MQRQQQVCQVRIPHDRFSEKRYIFLLCGYFSGGPLQQPSVHVKDPKGPTPLIRGFAGVNLSRVEYQDVSLGSHVVCAVVPKPLGTIFNYPDGRAFMGVAGKRVAHILGVEQLDLSDVGSTPQLRSFLNVFGHKCYLTEQVPYIASQPAFLPPDLCFRRMRVSRVMPLRAESCDAPHGCTDFSHSN